MTLKVIELRSGWDRMEDKDKLKHLNLEDKINWYYQHKDVEKVDFLTDGNITWAFITIRIRSEIK